MNKMDIVAFIFARGGSKELPGKNIRNIAGKPLIGWAIEHARAVKAIRRVIVSTDSNEIAAVAESFGAEVPFMRPSELAQDDSPEWMAWRHGLQYLIDTEGKLPNAMVSVPTTAPLRVPNDIERCLRKFTRLDVDAVVTVTDAYRSPWFNMVKSKSNNLVQLVNQSHDGIIRRQDSPKVYDMTTVSYVVKPEFVMSNTTIFSGRVAAVEIPRERAIDIDNMLDFEMANYLMEKNIYKR